MRRKLNRMIGQIYNKMVDFQPWMGWLHYPSSKPSSVALSTTGKIVLQKLSIFCHSYKSYPCSDRADFYTILGRRIVFEDSLHRNGLSKLAMYKIAGTNMEGLASDVFSDDLEILYSTPDGKTMINNLIDYALNIKSSYLLDVENIEKGDLFFVKEGARSVGLFLLKNLPKGVTLT